MRHYELPLIEEGTAEEQLRQIKSFLYRQAENLNYNLKNSDVTSLWRQTAEALSVASNEEVEQMRRDEFQALRGLIIKSATSIIKNEDSFSAHFAGDYTAESDYGTFTEEGKIFINGNPYTIGQVYKYQAQIVTDVSKYKTDMEGFIKTGVLERGTSKPVFGMEIGYNKNTYTVDGVEYQNNSPAKIRITPLRIGFWQNDFEAAYIENKAIYFPAAHITGGSIKIGDNFEVTNSGNMRALNATIEGTVRAGAGFIGGFEIRGSNQTEGDFWPCSLSSILTPKDDDYQYAVFMRGFYNENGTIFGAKDKTHVAFGVKSILKTAKDWSDPKDYLWYVNVQGHTYTTQLRAKEIATDYFKMNENNVVLGNTSYAKPIEFYTSDEIKIGAFKNKAKNIYILASDTIRIGQYSSASEGASATDSPSTANVKIQAKTLFEVGTSSYKVESANIYASITRFGGVVIPNASDSFDLGSTLRKWRTIYATTVNATTVNATTVNADYISGYVTIGKDVSDNFTGIKVENNGQLTFCAIVGDKEYKQYSLQIIVQYIRDAINKANTAQSTANTANSTANTANATANTAKSTADTAKSTANTAKSTADTANATANKAKSTADAAASTVESYVVWTGQVTEAVNNHTERIFSLETEKNKIYDRIARIETKLGM